MTFHLRWKCFISSFLGYKTKESHTNKRPNVRNSNYPNLNFKLSVKMIQSRHIPLNSKSTSEIVKARTSLFRRDVRRFIAIGSSEYTDTNNGTYGLAKETPNAFKFEIWIPKRFLKYSDQIKLRALIGSLNQLLHND